jgi:hypothetical protein
MTSNRVFDAKSPGTGHRDDFQARAEASEDYQAGQFGRIEVQ